MNPVYKAAAETTQSGGLLGLTTLLFLGTFIGWVLWAYWPSNRGQMDAYGRLPLEDDEEVGS